MPRAFTGGMEEVCGLPAELFTLRNFTVCKGPLTHPENSISAQLALTYLKNGYQTTRSWEKDSQNPNRLLFDQRDPSHR